MKLFENYKKRNEAEEKITELIDELLTIQRDIRVINNKLDRHVSGDLLMSKEQAYKLLDEKVKLERRIVWVVEEMGEIEESYRSTF